MSQQTLPHKQTDQRIATLIGSHKRTQHVLRELASNVRELTKASKAMQKELVELSHSFEASLEDLAYRTLPKLLAERFGLRTVEPYRRLFLDVGDKRLEVNLWGVAERQDGTRVRVVGETKSQLAPKHLRAFARQLTSTRPAWAADEAFPVLITHMAPPEVVADAEARGWRVLHSWELEQGT